jgi:hypothetical protein
MNSSTFNQHNRTLGQKQLPIKFCPAHHITTSEEMACQNQNTSLRNENNNEPEENIAEANIPTKNRFENLCEEHDTNADDLETGLTPNSADVTTSIDPALTSDWDMPPSSDLTFSKMTSKPRPIIESLNLDQLRRALGFL